MCEVEEQAQQLVMNDSATIPGVEARIDTQAQIPFTPLHKFG
jgi:hypothetical protein